MTVSISARYPAANADFVSTTTPVSLTLASDDIAAPVDLAAVNVWVGGVQVIASGVATAPATITADAIGGYDVLVPQSSPLPNDTHVAVRVVADDTAAGSAIDQTWTFSTTPGGPVLASSTQPAFSITTAVPVNIALRLASVGRGRVPEVSVAAFSASVNLGYQYPDVDGTPLAADNHLDFTPANDEDTVTNLLGARFSVDTGASAGQTRVITEVIGPGRARYDGAQLTGTETVTFYAPGGLDVVVDGERVVHSGVLDADAATNGWSLGTAPTVTGSDLNVTLAVPSAVQTAWSAEPGVRVPVHILCSDVDGFGARRLTSDINYYFDVVDTRGPRVTNLVPDETSYGLNAAATPASDVQFDILSSIGVDTATLAVAVNGSAAITAGAGTGNWSTSTVTPVDGGVRVVLKSTAAYTDGEMVFVDISVDDTDGRAGERRVLRYHFGTTVDTSAVADDLAGDDVVRVIAYDLSETSFGRPERLGHTGYAWDGKYYRNGAQTGAADASWFTELGAFPLAGHVIVTATNGWSIGAAQDAGAWATCAPATAPAWSMADNDSGDINDADFGPDAVLALATDASVILVDFVRDRAERLTAAGRVPSAGDISSRASDQSGGTPVDTDYALPTAPYTALAAYRDQTELVLAVASSGAMTVVRELSASLEAALNARTTPGFTPPAVVTRLFAGAGTWVRARLAPLTVAEASFAPLAFAYNGSGQGAVEVWDWYEFVANQGVRLFLDDGSTPALAVAEARDLDLVLNYDDGGDLRMTLAAMMVAELDVIDYDFVAPASSTKTAYSETDLGLNGITGAETSAVALEPGVNADEGYLYASVSKPLTSGSASGVIIGSGGGGNTANCTIPASQRPVTPGTFSAIESLNAQTWTDNGDGTLTGGGGGGGTINYTTGAVVVNDAGLGIGSVAGSWDFVSGDGRVTRFRLHSPSAANRARTLANGQPFTTLSAAGTTRVAADKPYIRTSMNVREPDTYVRMSMDVTT